VRLAAALESVAFEIKVFVSVGGRGVASVIYETYLVG
jgi:hypothetical protein